MKSLRQRQIICLFLALWLAMCTPASSQAFLTELVVGGSLLVEIGGTLIAALPQIAVFASSVLTLARTSEDIAKTVTNIFGIGSGKKKEKKEKPAPAQPAQKPKPKPQPQSKPAPAKTEKIVVDAELAKLIDDLAVTFTRQISLLRQIQELPKKDPAREALGAGYAELVSESSQKIETIVTKVLDGIENCDEKYVKGFIGKIQSLEAQSQVAMVPVLTQIVDRGKSFSALHGKANNQYLFDMVAAYAKKLTQE